MQFLTLKTDGKDYGVQKVGKGPEVRRDFPKITFGKGEQVWLCKIIAKRGEGVFNFDDWAAKKVIENAKVIEAAKKKQVEITKPPTPAELKKSQAEVDKLKGDDVMKFKKEMQSKHGIKVGLALLAAFSLAFAATAQELRYAVESLTLPGGATQFVAGGGTTNINASIDVRKQNTVAVSIAFKMTGTDTSTNVLTFQRSLDNSTWETLAAKKTAIGIAATSGTQTVTVTNIPTYGAGYIRLATWLNEGSESATNIVVSYAIKWAQ